MSDNTQKDRKIVNARLLKKYGSWIYCSECNKTVGYLCYTTYNYFSYKFTCNCGSEGHVVIGTENYTKENVYVDMLYLKKGRLCCPNDESPLFSIVDKNVAKYSYDIICKNCLKYFKRDLFG